ncbi:MAG: Single-stranded DNA-binding protein [Bacteriophage sp.]|nr:MAG: Single-stranded DNA-binding protein [Bacteriophage sp.]
MAENTEIMAADEVVINDLAPRTYDIKELSQPESNAFCSIKEDSLEAKKLVYNASNNPTHKIDDYINKEIALKDVFVEIIELANENTGELEQAPRIVLIDDKGESYQCVSNGIFGSLKKLMAIFGEPTWEDSIHVVVKQVKVKRGTMLTLEVA